MRTLYLRNVPDQVADRLERMARRERMSLGAWAVKELTEASKRADNAEMLGDLSDLDVPMDEIVAAVRAGRDEP